jgi:two-component system, LytTR family, sensor kinase
MTENPFVKDYKSTAVYLLVWLFISAFYFSLLYWGIGIPLETALPDSLIYNFIFAGLGLSLWYPVKFIRYEKEKSIRFLFTHLAGSIITVIIWLLLSYLILISYSGFSDTYKDFFISTLAWRILTGILFYFLFIAFYYLIIYYSSYEERKTREAELKSLITEAELKSLKFQINPHFIFNSLNSISSLTVTDTGKAREMIMKLADFLRYTISNNTKLENSLKEEVENIRLYLDIERTRFDDKFEYREEINAECLEIPLPNMLLQPLFENAIKHAVYETLDKIIIVLRCSTSEGFLKIEVENTCEAESQKKGTGVGLQNIGERLALIYKRRDLFRVEKTDNTFLVKIFIPLTGS